MKLKNPSNPSNLIEFDQIYLIFNNYKSQLNLKILKNDGYWFGL